MRRRRPIVEPPKMPQPSACRFSETHEWFHVDGDIVTVGITQYAADELTDITYVEMKPVGSTTDPGGPVGEVESVKTTTEVFCAVGGEIIEVNEALSEDPSLVNSDPHEAGWLVRVRTDDASPLDRLTDWATYDQRFPVKQ